MSLSVGDRLGRYEVLDPIGAGGMGEVWRALDSELDRQVAVKVLPESFASDASRLERFQREAKALAALSHPNLLDIYDVGSSNGLMYAVTELLEGDTLRQRITPSGLPWKKVSSIGAAVADGLACAHRRGIIHRDIKPENLFITNDGRVKILDFGLARVHEEADSDAEIATITDAGTVVGTPGYMAPEQLRGRPADARSDIFSLGCVLYEMAAGHRAFGGDTAVEVMAAILKEEPPQLSSSGARVPEDLERTVHRCMEKWPEARFQSAADLAYSLKSIGSGSASPAMATPVPTAVTPASGRPRWRLGVAAALLILAGVIGWQALTQRGGEKPPAEVAVTLEPNRIAVVPFGNQTGDEALDALGRRAADRILRELADVDNIAVAPINVVTGIAQGRAPLGHEVRSLVHDVATATASGLVLVGVIYTPGNEIEIQATLVNAASGRTVRSFDTLRCPRHEVDSSLDTLAGWVFVTVMEENHPSLRFGAGDRIPDPNAFREFMTGLPTFGIKPEARVHLERALELDPHFERLQIYRAATAWGIPAWERSDRLIQPLERRRSELTRGQQGLVEGIRWGLDGRWRGAMTFFQDYAAEHNDDCWAKLMVVFTAMFANHPQAALLAFGDSCWDPVLPSNAYKILYFNAAGAHHRLGQHEQELAVLNKLWDEHQHFFGTRWYRENEARALVALGRLDECQEVMAKTLTEPVYFLCDHGGMMVGVAAELRAHGHQTESWEMARRALDWFEAAEAPVGCSQLSIAALSLLGQHEQAYGLATGLLADQPDSWSLQAEVGVAAARTGDQATAEEKSRRLAEVDEPFTMGEPSYRRAAIAAQLGQSAEAIGLLQQAIARGFYDYDRLHIDINFDPIRDDPEFQEIMRPKG